MMPIGKRERVTMHLAAAVLFTCYLAQTIDCSRLKKTERREGRKEADSAKTIGVQDGKILFGRVFESSASLESQVTDGTKKSSDSVEDEAAYQADSAGWFKGETQTVAANPKEAAWKLMAPSLQCAGDQLKFRAVGPGASQFAVEQGNAFPMPLSQVPSTCGYSMQRNSLALVMWVPYDGCNMIQEGGSYVLPMRWQGIPVSLWCPKPAAPTPVPKNPVPQTSMQMPQNPGYFSPVTTAAPTTTKMTTAATKPKQPQYPQYPIYFYPPGMLPPVTTAVPTTTKMTTAATKPKQPQYPQYPIYFYPPGMLPPVTTAMPTTTKMTTAATKPKQPQYPQYPIHFYPPGMLPPVTTAVPTTTKMTTAATKPKQPQFPQYPIHFYPPGMLPSVTTAAPTTTTTTTAKPAAPFPPMVNPYPPFPLPWPFPAHLPPSSEPPTTTTEPPTTPTTTTNPTTTQSPQSMPQYHIPYPLPPYLFPPLYPPFPHYL